MAFGVTELMPDKNGVRLCCSSYYMVKPLVPTSGCPPSGQPPRPQIPRDGRGHPAWKWPSKPYSVYDNADKKNPRNYVYGQEANKAECYLAREEKQRSSGDRARAKA